MTLIPQHHRRLMPPLSAWVAFIVFGLLGETPALVIGLWLGEWSLIIGRGLAAASVLAGVLYAVWRVVGFHPLVRPPYRMWLRSSPWQPGEPLPLGPVGLTLTDLVVVVLFSIPGLYSEIPGAAVIAFVVTWIVGYVLVFLYLEMIRSACGILFLLGAVPVIAVLVHFAEGTIGKSGALPLLIPMLPVGLAVVAVHLRLLHSLRVMDWRNQMEEESGPAVANIGKAGWPVTDLGAIRPAGLPFGKPEMALVSLTAGWLCYSGFLYTVYSSEESGPPTDQTVLTMTMFFSLAVGVLRLGIYLARTRPPISLWGRLAKGPLVQWNYDRVFVTPLLGVLATYLLLVTGYVELLPMELAFGLAVAAVLMINGLGPPDIATFRLTGTHRFSQSLIQSPETVTLGSNQVKVGQV